MPLPIPGGLQMPPLQNNLALLEPGHHAKSLLPPCVRWVLDDSPRSPHSKEEMCKHLPRNNHLCQPKREMWAVPGRRARVHCSGVLGKEPSWASNWHRSEVTGCADGIARARFDAAASPVGMVQMRMKPKSRQTTESNMETP